MISTLVLFALLAPPDPGNDLQGFLREIFTAVQAGNWKYVAALAIIAAVFAVRKWGSKLVPALAKGKWAWATTVLIGALGALGNALAAGAPLGGFVGVLSILGSGAFVGAGAAGLFKGASEWLGPDESANADATKPPAP